MLLKSHRLLRFLYILPFLFFLNASSAQDGLYLSVQLMNDGCWGVYVKPVGVSPDSNTITGSGQVTLIFPLDFTWCCLTSYSGIWSSAAGTVYGPSDAPDNQIVSFGLLSAEPSNPIIYQAGQETLLFSFCAESGVGGDDCPEFMELINCGVQGVMPHPFCPPNSLNSNPGNDLSVIQFGGGIDFTILQVFMVLMNGIVMIAMEMASWILMRTPMATVFMTLTWMLLICAIHATHFILV